MKIYEANIYDREVTCSIPPTAGGEIMLKIGDTIRCHDKDDLLNMHESLAKAGVMTEFQYEKDGEKGLWLEVTAVES